ncbi:MAG: glutaminase A [Lyngbya sp. HA4199-MV5]|jgi:glutaminase|nr:glutaminase A [Lyngbya sp. HA4199-MV5]
MEDRLSPCIVAASNLNVPPTRLAALTQSQLENWVEQATVYAQTGHLPDYIPLLAQANAQLVVVNVRLVDGTSYSKGTIAHSFALMSVVKPLLLLFLLEQVGWDAVFDHVGMEPSEQPFHSLAQLTADRGFPRNPMLNSGAIALASMLPGKTGNDRCEALRRWLNQASGSRFVLDTAMLASVRSLRNETNRAIADVLLRAGHIDAIETALDTYNHICCLSGTVEDLAQVGLLLAQPKLAQPHGQIQPIHQRTVNALMLTCGLYEASGRFAVRIGLPTKSGVSGALLSVVPGQGAIACYSPALDATGNSIAGLFLLEQLTQTLNLSLFG